MNNLFTIIAKNCVPIFKWQYRSNCMSHVLQNDGCNGKNIHITHACDHGQRMHLQQENGRTARLCHSYERLPLKLSNLLMPTHGYFTIPITKPFLDFVHLILKCGSRTKATRLSPKNLKINNQQLPK